MWPGGPGGPLGDPVILNMPHPSWGTITPPAFETQSLGATFEAEATVEKDGQIIELMLAPKFVRLFDVRHWQTKRSPAGDEGRTQRPEFQSSKITTELRVHRDEPVLLGFFAFSQPEAACRPLPPARPGDHAPATARPSLPTNETPPALPGHHRSHLRTRFPRRPSKCARQRPHRGSGRRAARSRRLAAGRSNARQGQNRSPPTPKFRTCSQMAPRNSSAGPWSPPKAAQRAVCEAITEVRYATEYAAPTVAVTANSPANTKLKPTVDITALEGIPSAFETRNAGVTLEVEPVLGPDGKTIDLNIVPQDVRAQRLRKSDPRTSQRAQRRNRRATPIRHHENHDLAHSAQRRAHLARRLPDQRSPEAPRVLHPQGPRPSRWSRGRNGHPSRNRLPNAAHFRGWQTLAVWHIPKV